MSIQKSISEIQLAIAAISSTLEHTVTWKQLFLAVASMISATAACVWFLVDLKLEAQLNSRFEELKAQSAEALNVSVQSAKSQIIEQIQSDLQKVSFDLSESTDQIEKTLASMRANSIPIEAIADISSQLDQINANFQVLDPGTVTWSTYAKPYVTVPLSSASVKQLYDELSKDAELNKQLEGFNMKEILDANDGMINIPLMNFPSDAYNE